MKVFYELPFGIHVEVSKTLSAGGFISSDLHGDDESPEEAAAWDALESLILAHAVAGVKIDSPEYIKGIETAVEAISNNL